ncbi:MAG: hypothetical protein KDA44_16690, partial [Planctomycetales bacterium]|nr:hypothetical protein [Planctomycetales bacterium]
MNHQSTHQSSAWGEAVRLLLDHPWRWLLPTVLCGGLAVAYAAVMPRYWEASQGMVVRQEAVANVDRRPGQFADLYEMRTLQETILELAKSRQVVETTLSRVDAQLKGVTTTAPDDEAIEEFRKHLKMLPPNGAEFGKTEVFYFLVKDRDRQRAIALVSELCRQLESRLQELREARGRSLTVELEEQLKLAEQQHAAESAALEKFETSIGADLGELRLLHSANSGQSELRLQVVAMENESRRYETQIRDSDELLRLLKAAESKPEQIVAVPSALLASQPALSRLKSGLIDARLATARLRGTRSEDHPRVQAAVEAEQRIRRDLHRELAAAIRNAEADRTLAEERLAAVASELAEVNARLESLAEQRAIYSNYVAAVASSRETLNRAQQKLSAARATMSSAHSTSLVTTLDKPETGPNPEGPGRSTVAAAGVVGGFMLGLGVLVLTAGPLPFGAPATGQRRSQEEFDQQDPQREPVVAVRLAPQESSRASRPEWWESQAPALNGAQPKQAPQPAKGQPSPRPATVVMQPPVEAPSPRSAELHEAAPQAPAASDEPTVVAPAPAPAP